MTWRLRNILTISFFILCAVPLILALGYINVHFSQRYRDISKSHLSAMATIAKNRIIEAGSHVEDNARLIASRTRLRTLLSQYRPGSTESVLDMTAILEDALNSVDSLRGIAVYDIHDNLITSVGTGDFTRLALPLDGRPESFSLLPDEQSLNVGITLPVELQATQVGWLRVVCNGTQIIRLIMDRSGLGLSGEWLLAVRADDGSALFAVPLKYDVDAAFHRKIPPEAVEVPITQALAGNETLLEWAPDYRGTRVLAATRYLPDQDWGLVVKIDESEVRQIVREILYSLVALEIGLAALSIAMGGLLAHYLARPIERLRDVTLRVAQGDLRQVAVGDGWQEARDLADAFNTMTDSLRDLTEDLAAKVEERTAELHRANEQLAEQSRTDGLTCLANRRYFDEILDHEWLRAIRNRSGISLVMMDIDHFKQFNDTYGHLEGDRCLQAVAHTIYHAFKRPGDLPTRYGGEEFAVLLADSDRVGDITERCRQAIEALAIPHEASSVADVVTVSIGAATLFPQRGSTPASLVALADSRLYAAKKAGRNRVVSEGGEEPMSPGHDG